MSQKVKAVFFDAGGTLFRPFPSVGEIYARAASAFGGGPYDPKALEIEFHAAWKRRGGLASLGADTNDEKERIWWHVLVQEVFEPHGGVPDFEQFFKTLHGSFVEKRLWEIYPEVEEVLTHLKQRGFILGVVSNWDLRLPKVIKNLELDHHFNFLTNSSACGATKPAAKIFHEALKQAKALPEETVHVGDTYEEDFVGAARVGIKTFLLDREKRGNTVPEELRISNLKELCGRL